MSLHRFGSPDRFAVDIDVEPDEDALGSAFLAMSIGGVRFGATDRTEQLSTFLESLTRFLRTLPRAPAQFEARSAQAVFDQVFGLLNDPDPGRTDFPWELSSGFQRMVLAPNGCSSFDGDWAILLRESARDRLLVRPFRVSEVREVVLRSGEVEGVLRSVVGHPWQRWRCN